MTPNVENFEGDLESIRELIELAHNPALAEVECDHVFQLWEDGSITFQKCGELLWMRSIFRDVGGIDGLRLPMPCERGVHGYAFVTKDDAYEIGKQIVNLLIRYPQANIPTEDIARYSWWVNRERERAA